VTARSSSFTDLLNLTFTPPAKFVRRYGDAAALIRSAVRNIIAKNVEHHAFPSDQESYHLPEAVRRALDLKQDATQKLHALRKA